MSHVFRSVPPPGARRVTFASGTARRRGRQARAPLSLRQKREVQKMILKSGSPNYYNNSIASGTDLDQTGIVVDTTAVVQGDGQGERIQDKIQPMSLQLRGSVTFYGAGVASATNIPAVVRLMIVRWKPDTANDDLSAWNQVTEGSDPWDNFPKFDEVSRKKFHILHDQRFLLCSDHSTDANHPIVRLVDLTIPLKGNPIKYNEGLTTGNNKVYILMCSSDNTANTVETKMYYKLNYRDLE